MQQQSDLILVEAASRGDRDSFAELCRRYYGIMVAVAHSITVDRHLAEDAAQQAFAKAAVNMGSLEDKGKFAAWLGTICRNAARDILSKRRMPDAIAPQTGGNSQRRPRAARTQAASSKLRWMGIGLLQVRGKVDSRRKIRDFGTGGNGDNGVHIAETYSPFLLLPPALSNLKCNRCRKWYW